MGEHVAVNSVSKHGKPLRATILISRLLLLMRRMYVASFRLDFHKE